MNLEVKRVLANDVAEHEDILRTVFVIPETLVKMEQGKSDEDRTTLMFSWGEEITIEENIYKFKTRLEAFINGEDEKRKQNRKDEELGL
jgi:hypothetical protein